MAVVVEVCHRNCVGFANQENYPGVLERTVPLPLIDAHRVLQRACHSEVKKTIAVEVSHGYGGRSAAGRVLRGGLEGAIAIAQQHTDPTRSGIIGSGEIEDAVAVKVPHR